MSLLVDLAATTANCVASRRAPPKFTWVVRAWAVKVADLGEKNPLRLYAFHDAIDCACFKNNLTACILIQSNMYYVIGYLYFQFKKQLCNVNSYDCICVNHEKLFEALIRVE